MRFDLEIPPVVQRVLAVALVLLPLIAGAASLYAYASEIIAHRERIAGLESEKARYAALLHAAPQWDVERARLRQAEAAGDLAYTGKSLNDNARRMQATLSSLIASAGGRDVQNTIEAKSVGDDGPVEIRVTVQFTGDMAAIANALFQLKAARPVLVVDRLSIHNDTASGPERLRVDLVVSGFVSAA